jgi:hypothetical protein
MDTFIINKCVHGNCGNSRIVSHTSQVITATGESYFNYNPSGKIKFHLILNNLYYNRKHICSQDMKNYTPLKLNLFPTTTAVKKIITIIGSCLLTLNISTMGKY